MIIRSALSVLFFIAFCLLIEVYFGWATLLAPWGQQSWSTLLLATGLTYLSYWVRAMRLYDYFLVDMRGGFSLCFKLMLQHNLLNNLLPMRVGEVSFPVLMSRYFDVSTTRSLPALLWFRVMDLHLLVALALVASGSLWLSGSQAALLALLWLPLPWLMFLLQARLVHHLARPSSSRWQGIAYKMICSLPQDSRAFWHAWGWTVCNWLVKLGVFAWVLQLFLDMPASAAWLGAITGDVTSVLPFHAVAGAGTYEAGVVSGLMPFGLSAKEALPAAVNLHLFLLASTLVGGLLSLLLPGRPSHG